MILYIIMSTRKYASIFKTQHRPRLQSCMYIATWEVTTCSILGKCIILAIEGPIKDKHCIILYMVSRLPLSILLFILFFFSCSEYADQSKEYRTTFYQIILTKRNLLIKTILESNQLSCLIYNYHTLVHATKEMNESKQYEVLKHTSSWSSSSSSDISSSSITNASAISKGDISSSSSYELQNIINIYHKSILLINTPAPKTHTERAENVTSNISKVVDVILLLLVSFPKNIMY